MCDHWHLCSISLVVSQWLLRHFLKSLEPKNSPSLCRWAGSVCWDIPLILTRQFTTLLWPSLPDYAEPQSQPEEQTSDLLSSCLSMCTALTVYSLWGFQKFPGPRPRALLPQNILSPAFPLKLFSQSIFAPIVVSASGSNDKVNILDKHSQGCHFSEIKESLFN